MTPRATNIAYAQDWLQTMTERATKPTPEPLIQIGDEYWIVIKTTPGPGTQTGVGGYQTFYVPDGMKVVDVAYVQPVATAVDPRGFLPVPMKGQSPIAIGDGPIGATSTPDLIGFTLPGTNGLNFKTAPVTASGLHRGTIAGVYADTGIFYSTDPRTMFYSYKTPPAGTQPTLTNNSGDIVGEYDAANITNPAVLGVTTLWDSYQELAYGYKLGPVIDYVDQRGNAPWGLASAVAGPQSGYAWEFDYAAYLAAGGPASPPSSHDAAAIQAGIKIGPWNRIRYSGSQISSDHPGLISTAIGYAGIDASAMGIAPTAVPANANAVRFAIGQLELGRSEYSAVKVKVLTLPSVASNPIYGDAFGGDAGGTSNGKDHIWRYFDPTVVSLDPATLLQKVASDPHIAPGGTTSFKITFANLGSAALPNVVLSDPIPAGLTYLSAVPAPTSVSGATLTWNVGTVQPNQIVNLTIYVKGTGTGSILNEVTAKSNGTTIAIADDTVDIGLYALLREDKTVTPSSVNPGDTVTYTITVTNDGPGPNGTPLVVTDLLPAGFTYAGFVSATVNGATVSPAINSANPNQPAFSISQAIAADKTAVIKFVATVGAGVNPGIHYNGVDLAFEGKKIGPHPEAPVTVGGGQIGDTIFHDWNGNGVRDVGEEGMSGVTVTLSGEASRTAVTDSNGNYLFTGLAAGDYTVTVPAAGEGGVPAGYAITSVPPGVAGSNASTNLTLTANQQVLTANWGYKPGGTGTIGDQVFEDLNKNGLWDAGEPNIPNVTVWLYADSNNNGVKDATDPLIATTTTNGGGTYSFTGLDTTRNYFVMVDQGNANIGSYFNTKYGSSAHIFTGTSPRLVASGFTTYALADFGFWRDAPAAIGDQVYYDKDNSGTYNAGDIPLPNITVNLYAGDGTTLLATTVTATDGTYHFTGLSPGTYVVKVDTADGHIPSYLVANPSQYTGVTLTAGQIDNSRDFPFVNPGVLGKTVDKSQMTTPGILTFTLTPHYSANSPLLNATVTDTVPTGTTFNSAGQGGTNTPPVTWNLGSTTAASNGTNTISGATVTQNTITHVTPNGDTSNSTGTGGDTSLSLSVPTGTAANDVMIAALSWDGGNGTTITKPVGWTQIGTTREATQTGTAITYVAAASNIVHHASPTCAIPTGTVAGDVLIAAVEISNGHEDKGYSTIMTPTGWTLIRRTDLGTSSAPLNSLLLYWRVATASTPMPTWTSSNGNEHSVVGIISYRGVDPTDPIHKESAQANASSTTVTAPSITTTVANALLVGVFASCEPTPASGTTSMTNKRVDVVKPLKGNETGQHVIMGDETFAGPGTTGTRIATVGVASQNIGAMIALKPASATTKLGQAAYYKVAGGSEPTSYSWTISPGAKASGGISSYRGVDTTTPIDAEGAQANNTASSNAVAPSITPPDANTMLVGIFASQNAANATAPPGTMTETYDNSSGGTPAAGIESSYEAYEPANTATGTRTATLGAATINIGHLIALKHGTTSTPWSYTTTTALSANRSLVTSGDTMAVTLTLTATTLTGSPPFPISVTPGALGVTGTGGSSAAFGAASSSPLSLASGVPQSVTYTSTSLTPGANAGGVLTFKATPGDGNGTWAQGTANTTLITPPLTFTVNVPSPHPGLNAVINTGYLYNNNGSTLLAQSPPTYTGLDGSIGGYVWNDANGDGLQTGESGIPGVRVYVDGNSNGQYDAGEPYAITDATGLYRIYGLAAGTHTVRYDYGTVPAGYVPTTATSITCNLAANEQYGGADFGLRSPAQSGVLGSIGDTVWIDSNNNGVVDAGEVAIPNVTVNLYWDSDNSGTVTPGDILYGTTSTDANGNYSFINLPAGHYVVDVNEADTHFPAGGLALVSGGSPITSPPANGVWAVNLAAGTSLTTADFGYNYSGTIGDYVWKDNNVNGLQDESPPTPIAGAVVLLYVDANNNGVLDVVNGDHQIAAATTDANGLYHFHNLPPGKYLVEVYEDSLPNSPGIRDYVATTPKVVYKNLAAGETYLDADFGYYQGALVQGNVFWDANRDTIFDSGESGLSPVTVTLTGKDDYDNPISRTTTTNPSGHYQFLVPQGNYTVAYSRSDVTTIRPDLTDVTTPTSYTFYAPAGADYHPSYNFGVDNAGEIGGTIFADDNGNGSQGTGEAGLANVTVELYLDADNSNTVTPGDTLLDTQLTDASGKYLFVGIADGDYVVRVLTATLPGGYNTTPTAKPSTEWVAGSEAGATVASPGSPSVLDRNFGYQPIDTTYSVSGNVWNDANGNHSKDGGEAGIPGVSLVISVNGVAYTATTDSSGNYTLAGVPGNAAVVITVNTATLPNSSYVNTGDPDGVYNSTTTFTMAGANVINQDFGYQEQPGSIAGTVVMGLNGNGRADAGEIPLPGAKINLLYAGADGILGTGDDVPFTQQVTGTDGTYIFTGLLPGLYQITGINPPGFVSWADADGGNPDNIITTLAANENKTGQDFEKRPGTISGAVQVDANSNHVYDAGIDTPLPGVTLRLLDSGGNPVLDGSGNPRTAITDDNGTYSFTGLFPGDYQVAEDQPTAPGGMSYGSVSDKDTTYAQYRAGTGNPDLIGDLTLIKVTSGATNENNNFLEILQRCPDTWEAWQTKWDGPLHSQTDYHQNPDGDRYDNLIEYAFCLPPHSGALKPFCLIVDDQTAPGTVDGVFRRTAGGTLDVTYYLERSAALGDPTQWTTLAPITLTVPGPSITVTNKGDGTDIVRISNMEQFTGMLDGEGFVRMKVISHGETSYADVLGWTETKLGPTSPDPYVSGCSTYNNPYLHCATFTGTVDITDEYNNTVGVSGNTLGFTNSAGPISMASLLKPGVAYYLEVVNGTYDGHRYDVDAATANTVTLKTDTNVFAGPPFNTLDVVPIDLEGSQVIIRSHRTLGEMFPVTSFHADGGPESADQVQTYTEGRWTTYWLKNTTPAIWVELLGDGSDKAATVIPPGQGMFVLRRTSPISILSYGEVRENVFVRPLSQGLNLVGGGYPIDQSANGEVSGRGMDYMFGFYGSRDFKTADSFFIWKGDTTTGATGYDTYWLLHSEVPQHFMDRWVMAGDATLAPKDDTILFQSDRSVFIRMKNELDTYAIIPTPWDPNPSPWPPDDNPFPQ